MTKLATLAALFAALPVTTGSAATLRKWTFTLSDATAVALTLSDSPPLCSSSTGLGKDLAISTPALQIGAATCVQDPKRPNHLYGLIPAAPGVPGAGLFLYLDEEYAALMKQIAQSGDPGGPIGNAVNGTCPAGANAFIKINGQTLGDGDYVGYCLTPSDN